MPGSVSSTPPPALIPRPVSYQPRSGQNFELNDGSRLMIEAPRHSDRAADDERSAASLFATQLRAATGFPVPVSASVSGGLARAHDIVLSTEGSAELGDEGYQLEVGSDGVRIGAHRSAGLFRGLTTLRQLLPPQVEATTPQPGPWTIAGATITDRPRFGYRGAMLDVARHFFTVEEVKRYLDLLSLYKINTFHLHLSDDQGWRIQVDSWPRLTDIGSRNEVGGGPGGFYTEADFAELVAYAADRYIDIVPEIDTPGHTNAALACYPDLNAGQVAPPPYGGIEVGFSSLCISESACIPEQITYDFLRDVFAAVAKQSPGPLLHLGGDEAHVTPHEQYLEFIPRACALVTAQGKRAMGWHEIAAARLPPGTLVQYWGTDDARSQELARRAVAQHAQLVMSPANRVYLDMRYDPDTPYGQHWAGYVDVRQAYDWDPATLVPGVGEAAVAGVEAPIWTEKLTSIGEVEYMAFPRLPGVAEIGWSPPGRTWEDYRQRLGGQAPRWRVLDVSYFAAPQIPWS